MAGIWADQGVQDELDAMKGNSPLSTAKLRLYKNNVTPTNATVLADLTEADFSGYAAQTLVWGASSITAHIAEAAAATLSFTISSGTQNIYGWYVTNSAGTRLLSVERDPSAPVAMDASGLNVYSITLSVKAKDNAT